MLDLGVDAKSSEGTPVSAFCKSPEHVDELLRYKADFHSPGMPLGMVPMAKIAGMTNMPTLSALLKLRCDVNPPMCGLGIAPLMSAVALSRGNPCGVEIVRALLEHRANPNVASRQQGSIWLTMVYVGRAKAQMVKPFISLFGIILQLKQKQDRFGQLNRLHRFHFSPCWIGKNV